MSTSGTGTDAQQESVTARDSSATTKPAANRNLLVTLKFRVRYFVVLVPALFSILVSGCASIDLKRMTYDVLRQQDCLYNNFDELCTRSFALDYFDYTQARNHYLQTISRDNEQSTVSLPLQSAANVEQLSKLSAVTSLAQLDLTL